MAGSGLAYEPRPSDAGVSAFKVPRAGLMRRGVPFAHAGTRRTRISSYTHSSDQRPDDSLLSDTTNLPTTNAKDPRERRSRRRSSHRQPVRRRRGLYDRISSFPREAWDALLQTAAEWRADVSALPLETGARAAAWAHIVSFVLLLVRRSAGVRSYAQHQTLRFQSQAGGNAGAGAGASASAGVRLLPPARAAWSLSTLAFLGTLCLLAVATLNFYALVFSQASYRTYTTRIGLVPGDRAQAEADERAKEDEAPLTVSRAVWVGTRTTLRWTGLAMRWIARSIWIYFLAPPSGLNRRTEDKGDGPTPSASSRTLTIWTPPAACLSFSCIYSPVHWVWYEGAAHGYERVVSVSLLFSWAAMLLLSLQTYGLVWFEEKRLAQREKLASEVLYEYDARFVQPTALPIVTEHQTQTDGEDRVQEIIRGYPYPQYGEDDGYDQTVYY